MAFLGPCSSLKKVHLHLERTAFVLLKSHGNVEESIGLKM